MIRKVAFLSLTSLLLLFTACKKTPFKKESQSEEFFHIQCNNYAAPLLVRGNTTSEKIILYIQGGPGLNTLDFALTDYPEWKDNLEKDYALAYYDQRGTGNRQDNINLDDISIDTYVDDLHQVASFLQKAYDAEITFLGHSFGGILIYHYLLKYGDDGIATNYITLNAPATSDEDQIRWEFRRDFLYNTAQSEIAQGIAVTQWQEVLQWLDEHPVIQKLEGTDDPWRDIRQWNQYVNDLIVEKYPLKGAKAGDYVSILFNSPYNLFPAYLNNPKTIDEVTDRLFEDMYEAEIITKLDQIEQPLLLITGRHDDICPPEELEYMMDHLGSNQNQLIILENASHDSFLHQKEAFINAINNYIQ
jgi:pimeloyl-ACP methyl ester carboxylesterase